jgi:hypothetical protein
VLVLAVVAGKLFLSRPPAAAALGLPLEHGELAVPEAAGTLAINLLIALHGHELALKHKAVR